MTGEPGRRRDEILSRALDLPTAERALYLDAVCAGDSGLRADMDRLLQIDRESHSHALERPADTPPTLERAPAQQIGRFEVLEELGRGGMGVVYRVHDPAIKRDAALKLILEPFATNSHVLERFERELRLLGRFEHQHVVRIYEVGRHGDAPYIVTELLKGETLASAIAGGRCGDPARKLDIARQTARALRDVHAAGIVHRDIKPANIFLEASGNVKLLDFGIARSDDQAVLTQPGVPFGSPPYMSPEQFRGDPVTLQTDVYGFGIVLAELFSERRLYVGDAAAISYRVMHEPLPLASLAGKCPPGVLAIIERATAKQPQDRYSGFGAILDELGSVTAAPHGESAVQASAATPARGWLRLGLAGGALVGVLLVLATLWYLPRRQADVSSPPTTGASPPSPAVPVPLRSLRVRLELGDPLAGPPAVGSPVAIGGAGRFRLRVSPGDDGFLYVFAEPLAQAPLYVLFPSETANEGRSAVRQGVTLGVPESSWLMFGPRRGLHRLWLVWSRKPMPDLEATTVWANGNDAGEIRDDGQRARVRATLAPVPASLDAQSGEYRLAGRADVMSGYIDFKR